MQQGMGHYLNAEWFILNEHNILLSLGRDPSNMDHRYKVLKLQVMMRILAVAEGTSEGWTAAGPIVVVDHNDVILFSLDGCQTITQSVTVMSCILTCFFLSNHCFICFCRWVTKASIGVGVPNYSGEEPVKWQINLPTSTQIPFLTWISSIYHFPEGGLWKAQHEKL